MVALQGEVGTSSDRSRDMKSKLTLVALLLTTRNDLLSAVAAWTLVERSS